MSRGYSVETQRWLNRRSPCAPSVTEALRDHVQRLTGSLARSFFGNLILFFFSHLVFCSSGICVIAVASVFLDTLYSAYNGVCCACYTTPLEEGRLPSPLHSYQSYRFKGRSMVWTEAFITTTSAKRHSMLTSNGSSSSRTFSSTVQRRDVDLTSLTPTPITHLSETEGMMAESVSKFAQEQIGPKVRDMDEAETMDPVVVEQLFEQGLMGVEIPEEYGGAGMNFTAAIVGIEELARVDPSVSVMVDVHNTLVNTAIIKYASEESKRKWLPMLATNTVGSFCLSEPVSGSDAFALQTKAVKTDSGYKLNGSKMWITNSMEAGFFIVFANLDPSKGYKGITAFIVEKDTPGFSIAKKEKKLGIRASSTCVLNFDDVEIPKSNLLGQEGHGYKYAISLLNEGRIGIAAQMTGLALGAWENAAR